MSLSLVLLPTAIAAVAGATSLTKDMMKQGKYYKIHTVMKDERILQEALENRGTKAVLDERKIEASFDEVDIIFQREEDDTISAIFQSTTPSHVSEEFLYYTEKEYKRLVQENTYETLMQRAKDEGLLLQSKTVNEENTMVLTFEIEE